MKERKEQIKEKELEVGGGGRALLRACKFSVCFFGLNNFLIAGSLGSLCLFGMGSNVEPLVIYKHVQ